MKYFAQMIGVVVWVAGMVIAKGFWSTLFAVMMPVWSYYLVIEKLMTFYGVI